MQRNPGQQKRSDERGGANDVDHLLPPYASGDGPDFRRDGKLAHEIFDALYGCGSIPIAASALPIATVIGCMAMVALRSVRTVRTAWPNDSGSAASSLRSSLIRDQTVGVALRWT